MPPTFLINYLRTNVVNVFLDWFVQMIEYLSNMLIAKIAFAWKRMSIRKLLATVRIMRHLLVFNQRPHIRVQKVHILAIRAFC
jgi:replication initiation and membrane attachment protein DnaB